MSERFFLAAPPRDGRGVLEADEARHLGRVLRARVGDEVVVFAGDGVEWPARIVRIGRDEVEVELGPARPDAPAAGPSLTLAVALPKGERQKWMVEKLTELGVARLVPLETTRGVAEATAGARARLERGVLEACKQCGRNTLMEIAEPRSLATLLGESHADRRVVVADPAAPAVDAAAVRAGVAEVVALVGPEGGLTADELAAADRAAATRVGLGPHILRVETAAIALAARLA